MFTSLIAVAAPLLIKLITIFVNNKVEDNELKKQWLSFVVAMQKKGVIPSQLTDEYRRQLDQLERDEEKTPSP